MWVKIVGFLVHFVIWKIRKIVEKHENGNYVKKLSISACYFFRGLLKYASDTNGLILNYTMKGRNKHEKVGLYV